MTIVEPAKSSEASSMECERRRDSQQWILDWVIKQTGREQNFEYNDRTLPPGVKNYGMIPAATEQLGWHCETIASAAERRGHRQTALELYFRAAQHYRQGQHAIFRDDDEDKIYLYERLDACYDHVITLNESYLIERVEIPWRGKAFAGLFHRFPGEEPRPTVLLLPGMDMTKESYPDPSRNPFLPRGMNVLAIDGPGQGSSNLRKIRVSADNYEDAASSAVSWLLERPDVDAGRIAVVGLSMSSYWAYRHAAIDQRISAVATAAGCYGGKREVFEQSSPRFKQIFMYMAGIQDEVAFDRMAEDMHLVGYGKRVRCPALVTAGQYDPLTPLHDTLALYDELAGPKELWVLENDFHSSHRAAGSPNLGGMSVIPMMIDWLSDALEARLPAEHDRQVLIPHASGMGSYTEEPAAFTLRERRMQRGPEL